MRDKPASLILGRYRLLGELAVGGTARVFRARDEQLHREVAVKLLHPHLLPDETSRRRLAAEARAAAGLSHPGIAAVYDVDTHPDAPALVMELVDGESLAQRLSRSGPMPPPDVARLGAEVADALYHAHRHGIVHRDVKPGNILLERQSGRARVVDFGIAHSLAAGAESLTQTGTALGTPRYMAPEQMAGDAVGPRTDLWSLGAVLHEALTGSPAFDGPTPVAIAQQQRAGPAPLQAVDASLAEIVRACLSYEVADRPLHAGAVASALRTWSGGPADATTRTQVAVAAPGPSVALAAPPRSPRRGGMLLAAGAALGAVLLAGVVLAGGLRPGAALEATPEPTPEATPDWMTPLLAAHAEACDAQLSENDLAGMDREEAEATVNELLVACAEADAGDEGGDADEGRDGGNGRGNGNGPGGNSGNGGGNGNGRGG